MCDCNEIEVPVNLCGDFNKFIKLQELITQRESIVVWVEGMRVRNEENYCVRKPPIYTINEFADASEELLVITKEMRALGDR